MTLSVDIVGRVAINSPEDTMPESTTYGHTSHISGSLMENTIVDHSGAVEASPVGTASTASSFLT